VRVVAFSGDPDECVSETKERSCGCFLLRVKYREKFDDEEVDSERIVEPQSRVFPLVVDFDISPQVNPT